MTQRLSDPKNQPSLPPYPQLIRGRERVRGISEYGCNYDSGRRSYSADIGTLDDWNLEYLRNHDLIHIFYPIRPISVFINQSQREAVFLRKDFAVDAISQKDLFLIECFQRNSNSLFAGSDDIDILSLFLNLRLLQVNSSNLHRSSVRYWQRTRDR